MTFEPEMGQQLFGNTEWFEHEAPPGVMDMVAVLGDLVVGGPHERGGMVDSNPVGNVASCFANDTFAIRSYCWCDGGTHPGPDEGGPGCPPNFHHYASDFQITWYKHSERGQSCNKEAKTWGFLLIFEDCVESIRRDIGGAK